MNKNDLKINSLKLERPGWSATFDTKISQGTWTSLIGPSGAGKTTLLELIAGFEEPSSGSIIFDNIDLCKLAPHKRDIGYVFQQNSLFPKLTSEENLLLALHDAPGTNKTKSLAVKNMAMRVGIENRLHHKPGELSGGELARINLARALLRPCKILLLDEPFAALDAPLRREMNGLVRELHNESALTVICVTHHPEDALMFADDVLVFARGEIIAQGNPKELAQRPPTAEVAKILDAGLILPLDSQVYYVRNPDLTCSSEKMSKFSNTREYRLTRWKIAETSEGVVAVCLNSGRAFSLDAPMEFNGVLFFDANKSHRF